VERRPSCRLEVLLKVFHLKVKGKFALILNEIPRHEEVHNKHRVMSMYGGVKLYLQVFLTSVGVSGQLHAPVALPPGEEPLLTIQYR
jgi:hypothetical protein